MTRIKAVSCISPFKLNQAPQVKPDPLLKFRGAIRDAAIQGRSLPLPELLRLVPQNSPLRNALIDLRQVQGKPSDDKIQRIMRVNNLNAAEKVAFVLTIHPGQGIGQDFKPYLDSYVPGKVKRSGLRNRFSDGGFVYNVATKEEVISAEKRWIKDEQPDVKTQYEEEVKSKFDDDKTPEQIQAEILLLRQKYHPTKYQQEMERAVAFAKEINQKAIRIFSQLSLVDEKDIIIAMILAENLKPDTSAQEVQNWINYMRNQLKIDDIELFTKAIEKTKKYVHVVGKMAGLAGDLELINFIFKIWRLNSSDKISEFKKKGFKIYLVAKSKRIAQEATVDDIKKLVNQPRYTRYKLIQKAWEQGLVKIIDSGSEIIGTDLTKATPEFSKLIKIANEGKAVLGFRGEENNFTINLINAPHFRFFLASSRDSQIMTGLQWIEDSLIYDDEVPPVPYPVIIQVPAGIEPAKDYFGVRQTRMEMKTFQQARNILMSRNPEINWDLVRQELGKGPYRTLVEYVVDLYPQEAWPLLFEVYPGKIDSGKLSSMYKDLQENGIDENNFSFFNFCKWLNSELKERIMTKVVEIGLGGEYDVQAYKTTEESSKISNKPIAQFERRKDGLRGKVINTGTNQLVLRAILVEHDKFKNKGLSLDIVAAHEVKPEIALFYPDKVLNKIAQNLIPLISHTGGYFWPPALKRGIDDNTPPDYQRISKLNGIIDMKVKDGKISMLPVYNKAVVIIYQDGRVQFARLNLKNIDKGEITLTISGKPIKITWTKEDVDSQNQGNIAVFTPMNSKVGTHDDIVLPAQPRNEAYKLFNDNYKVGAGRFNIVLVGDGQAYIYYNAVYLQPEGIIISLSEDEFKAKFGDELAKQIKKENNTAQDPSKETPPFQTEITNISIKLPENIDLGNVRYLYGGLTLVWTGQNKLPDQLLKSIIKGKPLLIDQYKTAMEAVEAKVRNNFRTEGWYNDISRVTQETQLQQLLVRGPRCYWVKTKKYLMIIAAEGREDTALGLNFPEAVYFAYQKLFDLLVKKNKGNKEQAKEEFQQEVKGLEILNWDGGSSVGLGSFISLGQANSLQQKHLAILERCSGPSNSKGSERPVPILVVYSAERVDLKSLLEKKNNK